MNGVQRASRRAFGAGWMTVYGAAATSVVWWALWPAPVALAIWCGVTLALGLVISMQLVRVRQLTAGAPRRTFDRRLARNIGIVIGVYAVVEGVAAGGIHAIGQRATEIIHIGQAVLAFGGTVEYFRDAVFNYPTLAEAYKVAALNGLNKL